MLLKKTFALIIFSLPLILNAQSSTYHTYADDEMKLAKMEKPVSIKMNFIKELIEKKNNEILKLSESPTKHIEQHNIDSLNKILDKLYERLTTVYFNFIRNNPSSLLSLHKLSMLLSRSAGLPLYVDTITTLYNHLNKSMQNSVPGRHFKLMLINLNNSRVGSLAPAFTVNDINNYPIALSSFRNKEYVLLDFWASWCVSCRADIPYLKEINKKYNPKGLQIIGISKDDDISLWKKAILEEKIENWMHILAPLSNQKNDSLITNKYFVYSIPVMILINKEGIIIGRWNGSADENMAELKKLLNKDIGN